MTSPFEASLQAIRQRLEAATPGPWSADEFGVCPSLAGDLKWVSPLQNNEDDQPFLEADAQFIAHSRTDIARLLAAVNLLIEQREYWMRQLDGDEAHMQFSIDQDNTELARIMESGE